MTKMKLTFYISLFIVTINAFSQTSDDAFKEPLRKVLTEIETRFQVKLEYSENIIKDRWVTYAGWRFRNSVEKTLDNILPSLDLSYSKTGTDRYRIRTFEYHRRSPEEGKEQLESLASLYNDVRTWEDRREKLRACMKKTLGLDELPAKPNSAAIVTEKRKMDGYTVQNVAIETLPGLFVCGSLYRPLKQKGKLPIVLNPDGHFSGGRFRPDAQYRCAMLARMGAIAFSYDLFAWGESLLQFKTEDHRRSQAMKVQALNSIRIIDYLSSLEGVDPKRIGITGASGGGSQTMLITALDDRVTVSVPVVMLSAYFSGGCPCESGLPAHLCEGGTNNAEIAAMAAPRPQLVISDGKDWSDHVPEIEFPYLQRVYGFYGKTPVVQNIHLKEEGHDYGVSKRLAMYKFMAEHLKLDMDMLMDKSGKIDESTCTIEEESALYVFGKNGERLPAHAIRSFDALTQILPE